MAAALAAGLLAGAAGAASAQLRSPLDGGRPCPP